jgi:hypothetical protein
MQLAFLQTHPPSGMGELVEREGQNEEEINSHDSDEAPELITLKEYYRYKCTHCTVLVMK